MKKYEQKIERDYKKALEEFTTKESAIKNAYQIALYQEIKNALLDAVTWDGFLEKSLSLLNENTIKAIEKCKENIFEKIYDETICCNTKDYNWFDYKDLECFINEVFE